MFLLPPLIPVICGIPQGTVFRPLIFLLCVNDIADKVSPLTTIKLFADDYRTTRSVADQVQLQQDLDSFVSWLHTWLMFNAAKCHLLMSTRKTYMDTCYAIDTLQRVDHHPYTYATSPEKSTKFLISSAAAYITATKKSSRKLSPHSSVRTLSITLQYGTPTTNSTSQL